MSALPLHPEGVGSMPGYTKVLWVKITTMKSHFLTCYSSLPWVGEVCGDRVHRAESNWRLRLSSTFVASILDETLCD